MKYKSLALAVLLMAIVGSAFAQNKISGKGKCAEKPDASQSIEVGDQPGHMLIIEKDSCTWSVPLEMAGLKSKTYTLTEEVDLNGAKSQDLGYVLITMENDDKAYLRFQGMSTVGEKGLTGGGGTWSFTGGTGKLKGLKGKGTYKVLVATGGAVENQVEGEYSLPEASATNKKK